MYVLHGQITPRLIDNGQFTEYLGNDDSQLLANFEITLIPKTQEQIDTELDRLEQFIASFPKHLNGQKITITFDLKDLDYSLIDRELSLNNFVGRNY